MYFVVIGKDKADGEARRQRRGRHLDFIADAQDGIVYGGPLIEDGDMVGSLIIFDLPNRAALDARLAEDPYFEEGMFESVEIYESRWLVPEPEPGFLRAEANRARAAAES